MHVPEKPTVKVRGESPPSLSLSSGRLAQERALRPRSDTYSPGMEYDNTPLRAVNYRSSSPVPPFPITQ